MPDVIFTRTTVRKLSRLSFIVAVAGTIAVTGAGISAPSASGGPLVSFNPVAGNQGFTVFVEGNATLSSSSAGGPVALGGNLTLGSNTFNVATQTAGTFTAAGDAEPAGLLINGTVNWAGSGNGNGNGAISIGSSGYVKVGNLTGSTVAQSGTSATHVVPAGQGYSSQKQIADTVFQPTASVSQAGLIGFASAFSTFSSDSAGLGSCSGTVVLDNQNGMPLPATLPANTSAYLTLNSGVQNVLNVTAANLANISTLQFQNTPSASTPLIINISTTGSGNTFTWSPPNFNGLQTANAAYILWNFPTATALTLSGSSAIPGTVYAPGSTVTETDQNGINGGVIAAAYTQGVSSGGGQVTPELFATTVQSCASTAPTLTSPSSLTWAATDTGSDQSAVDAVAGDQQLTAADNSGTGAGWHITVSATTFTTTHGSRRGAPARRRWRSSSRCPSLF